MAEQWIYEELKVVGMSSTICEMKVENSLKKKAGIYDIRASFVKESVKFSYDPQIISIDEIRETIEQLDYKVIKSLKTAGLSGGTGKAGSAEPRWVTAEIKVEGMSCPSCEMKIENALKKKAGIRDVKANYAKESVKISYDLGIISIDEIKATIEKLDYKVRKSDKNTSLATGKETRESGKFTATQLIAIGVIIFAVYFIIQNTVGFNFIPQVSQNMGYGLLFVVGLITSLHCVAMCGGINLSQCVSYKVPETASKAAKLKPSLMYNTGRVISYTVIGGIVGGLGSVISFSGTAKGIVAILAGVFMLIMGLNMTGLFPWLRKIVPHMPKRFANKKSSGKYGPFVVGLLNGLMPCGPLQAMQIYALGTGSVLAGAASMLFFSLGTVPLMFGFGAISSFLSGKFTKKMMKVSAVLVMFLGVIMLTRGFALSGFAVPSIGSANAASIANKATISGSEQDITTTLQSGSYTPITVQKGIPVKWTIKADANSINGCNETIQIPQYSITKKLQPGDNVISFTPDKEGTVPYSCWMGMIRSNITVVSDLGAATVSSSSQGSSGSSSSGSVTSGGGCCGNTPAAFAGGKIPTDNIGIAKINGNEQDVTIDVGDEGYSPAVVVVQKGIPVKITFTTSGLSSCNSSIYFPDYGGGLNLSSNKVTPLLPVTKDFTFQCSMNMLHGYVKVVDDINKVDMNAVKQAVQNYKPASGSGGGGCCG